MIGQSILDFIGGYIEYVFVPPFIADWQQLTAERSVNQARKYAYSKLTDDMNSINKNIKNTESQLNELICVMKQHETDIKALSSSPTDNEFKKTLLAKYCIHVKTVRQLREFIQLMTRIKSELLLRIAILQTTRNSISLKSSPEYITEFEQSTRLLLTSESQTDEIMSMLYSNGPPVDWDSQLEKFIGALSEYDISRDDMLLYSPKTD